MAKVQETFFEQVLEKFGEDSLSIDRAYEAISTGCTSLDVSIGIGGVPKGRITEIFGPEGSAKTTIALSLARNAIANGEKVLYVEPENLLDYFVIPSILGESFPEGSFRLVQPDTAEDAFEIAEMGINSKEFSLIVFDSIGALAPAKEKEDKFTDANVALVPRLLSKFLRRNAYSIRANNIAFVFINQVRDTIGSYVKSYSTPGGHALKHFAALRISLSKGQEIKITDAGTEKSIGINTTFVIKKNKLAAPFRSFTIPIIFGIGVDKYKDLFNFAETLGVIRKAGAYYKLDDVTIAQGTKKTVQELHDNKELLDRVTERVYNMFKGELKPELLVTEDEFLAPIDDL